MKAETFQLREPVRVELRVGHGLIERSFPAGTVTPGDADERLALEHLVGTGHAERVKPAQKSKEASE